MVIFVFTVMFVLMVFRRLCLGHTIVLTGGHTIALSHILVLTAGHTIMLTDGHTIVLTDGHILLLTDGHILLLTRRSYYGVDRWSHGYPGGWTCTSS